MKYLYVQINNDYSGSAYAIDAIIKAHNLKEIYVMTDFTNDGFINKDEYQNKLNVNYSFKGKGIKTIIQLLKYYFLSSFKLIKLFISKEIDVVYINTILPFNSSILGKFFKKKVIYHIHEFYVKPSIFIKLCLLVMRLTADKIIYVSQFTKKVYFKNYSALKQIEWEMQYTPIRFETTTSESINYSKKYSGPIIMICSPKKYKGVEIFVSLAKLNPNNIFHLYLSGKYFFKTDLPSNLEIIIKYDDIKSALFNASVCLNLSQQPYWVETFGLTIWEALSQGTPVIVPDIGGPLEIVEDNCGIICNTRNLKEINEALKKILDDELSYVNYSKSSILRSNYLKKINFIKQIK
tara:strand:- start:455 stop:1504 length:1050 start_codon:yes stop_codon:yes gene_type:complete